MTLKQQFRKVNAKKCSQINVMLTQLAPGVGKCEKGQHRENYKCHSFVKGFSHCLGHLISTCCSLCANAYSYCWYALCPVLLPCKYFLRKLSL